MDPLGARGALQALLREALSTEGAGLGYALGAMTFGSSVEATLEKGGTAFVLWLRPIEDGGPCFRKTLRFKVGYRGDAPDASGYALIDAICARVEEWERALSGAALAELFDAGLRSQADTVTCELLAVCSGVKPACRILADSESALRLTAQARAAGMHVAATNAEDFVAGFCSRLDGLRSTVILHIGRTEDAAAAAAAVERAMIETCRAGLPVTAAQVRALGLALGYPECCIDAFVPVRDQPNSEIKFHALRRTPATGARLLNTLLETRGLISHLPCRYDCAPSLEYARALFRELARAHPVAAAELERGLGGLFISFCGEGALGLSVEQTAGPNVFRFTTVEASGGGPRLDAWRDALLGADGLEVVGREVRISRRGEPTRVLDAPADRVQIRPFV